MDADRFDALSHIVTSDWNRRGVVRALIGLAVGSGLPPALAERVIARKKRRRKKKPCAPCQRRTNGRCRGAQPDGTRCGECGTCLDGVCTPATTLCGGTCSVCDATARCRTQPDDAACDIDGKCLNGTCNPPPTCERPGTECDVEENPQCCSDFCCSGACRVIPGQGTFCRQGFAGTPCLESTDCAGELACIGFRCT